MRIDGSLELSFHDGAAVLSNDRTGETIASSREQGTLAGALRMLCELEKMNALPSFPKLEEAVLCVLRSTDGSA